MNRCPTVPVAPRTPTGIGCVGCCIPVRGYLVVKADLMGDELANFFDAAADPPDVLVVATDIDAMSTGGEVGCAYDYLLLKKENSGSI